jgi:hypothetical protein
MPLDFNNAPPQFGELIPPQIVKVIGHIRAGGTTLPGEDPGDAGLFKASKEGDVCMLDWEFTIMFGPNAKSNVWQNMTISGGKTDPDGTSIGGKFSKGTLRAMIESARGIMPDDMSPAAMAGRQPPCYAVLNGIEFVAKIGIKPESEDRKYKAASILERVVTPDKPEYARAMAGESIPVASVAPVSAKPVAAVAAGWAAPASATPGGAWAATSAAPAATPATPAATAGAWGAPLGTATAAAPAAGGLPAWASK